MTAEHHPPENLPILTGTAYPAVPVAADELTDEAARLVWEGLAENTRLAYAHDWNIYLRWATEAGRTPIPASAATLANYVAYLTATPTAKGTPHSPASIDRALGCILHVHKRAHLPKPNTEDARLALRAYRKQQAKAGRRKKKSPPITIDRLRLMISALPADTAAGLRDRAALVLGFAMMGRRSEIAALDIGDLTFTENGVSVFVALSKTDKDAHGETVNIGYGSRAETCPVRVLNAWLAKLAEHGITSGALLRPVDRYDNIGGVPGPRGGRGQGDRVTGHGINFIVKRAAVLASLPKANDYSAHGLRAGGATSSAKSGKGLAVIARHGRWAEGSPVVAGYIREVDKWTDNAMGDVGL
uniref:tyrosine-type recombinase/integrase n=1 Tax=Streptosporangium sp. CA-235898 TaxID=3240073 RepID=UPI003F49A006